MVKTVARKEQNSQSGRTLTRQWIGGPTDEGRERRQWREYKISERAQRGWYKGDGINHPTARIGGEAQRPFIAVQDARRIQ